MPASPEVGEAERTVGEAEVVGQPEAEYGCCTDTHVAIAREVEVYLYGVAQQCRHVLEAREGLRSIEHPCGELSDVVAHHVLLHQSEHDEPQSAPHHAARCLPVAAQTRYQVLGACYRSGEEQWKECEVEEVFEQRGVHREAAAVDIHSVTDALERIERNAHGQHYRT